MSTVTASAPEPLRSISAAAREVGVSRAILARLVHQRRVASVNVAGMIKVRLSEVRAAIHDVPASV